LPEFYLDLAGLYAIRKRDIEKARAALIESERDELPDVMKPHQLLLRGVVANLEGDFPGAQRDLEEALKRMEATRHLPFRARDICGVKAYLSQAMAKQGNFVEAKRYYCAAKPYLAATEERELMTDCEKVLRIESA
jgi:hypothetical protein